MIEHDLSTHPNDSYFKDAFSQPTLATSFFQAHLPPAIVQQVNWADLTLQPGSFVKKSLQQSHSDLLFSTTIRETKLLLYLLFEHQTTVDPAMPLRLLGYITEILTAHEKQHGLPLPMVLPLVLHQGPEKWTPSTQFQDLFRMPPGLRDEMSPFVPAFRHALHDLSQHDPAHEERDPQLRVVLQLMKLAREKRLVEFLNWIPVELERLGWDFPVPLILLSYLYAIHVDSNLDLDQIAHTLQANPSLQENVMSLADRLIAKGHQEGHQEGHKTGLDRGSWHGRIQLLQQLMQKPVSSVDILDTLSMDELQRHFAELECEYNSRFKAS